MLIAMQRRSPSPVLFDPALQALCLGQILWATSVTWALALVVADEFVQFCCTYPEARQ